LGFFSAAWLHEMKNFVQSRVQGKMTHIGFQLCHAEQGIFLFQGCPAQDIGIFRDAFSSSNLTILVVLGATN
jgi:hypothetical protein